MMRFRQWINENFQSEKNSDIQKIWTDTFNALGIGGLSDEDAAQQSLSKITYNSRNSDNDSSTFKGKQAVRKRLENGQIFSRLEKIGDPEIEKNLENVKRWLDSNDGKNTTNSSTTVSGLLQKLFGQKNYENFIDSKFPKADQAQAKVQPMPPKPDMGQNTPNNPPPDQNMPPKQPDPNMPPPQTDPNMPPKPAGAELGMY